MFLSVVIPAYNEEKIISVTLGQITNYLQEKNYSSEILLVDDGSKDSTVNIVEGFSKANKTPVQVLKNNINRGKGYAVRRGVLLSKGEYILVTDADLSTPIEEWEKLLKELERGFDVVIGSRGLDKSLHKVRRPWYRQIMGKAFNILVRLLLIRGLNDTQCGFKSFSRKAVAIFEKARINDFSYDVELLYIAKKAGYNVKDVAVLWIDSLRSKVKLYRDPFKMFISLFRIRINDARGYYD